MMISFLESWKKYNRLDNETGTEWDKLITQVFCDGDDVILKYDFTLKDITHPNQLKAVSACVIQNI